MLRTCPVPLWERYDLAILDLDGVVYVGPDAVPGAPAALAGARAAGMHLAYVTNNAARPPEHVAAHLCHLGIAAAPEDVVTSAQAAARLVAEACEPGAAVFVIGGEGLFASLREQGLRPVQDLDDDPVAVVSGYHPDLTWKTVSDGAIAVRRGLPWFASNTDRTVPTPHGRGLGNGVLVGVVAEYAGREPVVAGKPLPPLFEETQRRVGGRRPLVVGDRLDTDIEGAVAAGLDSLLVLTGVTGVEELLEAPPHRRPTYLAPGLDGLGMAHPAPEPDPVGAPAGVWGRGAAGPASAAVRCGGWAACVRAGRVEVSGQGDEENWFRAVATAAWRHLDATGQSVRVDESERPGSVSVIR